eukprot:1157664-Pelagomonas_calceolata.AAC.11
MELRLQAKSLELDNCIGKLCFELAASFRQKQQLLLKGKRLAEPRRSSAYLGRTSLGTQIYCVVLGKLTPFWGETRVTEGEVHPPNRLPEPRLASPSARLS